MLSTTRPADRLLVLLVAVLGLLAAAAPAPAAPTVEAWDACGAGYNSGSYDDAHTLYVPCGSPSTVMVYGAEGQLRRTVKLPFYVTDVAPSPSGAHLYVTSPSMTPRRLNRQADGSYVLDAAWRLASFSYGATAKEPRGMFLDTDDLGNVYLAHGAWVDASPHTVLKYRPDGTLVRRFGEYTYYSAGDARSWNTGFFYWALNGIVAAGDGGAVYTVESGNNRIQKWTRQGDGSYTAAHFAGGTAATDAGRKGDCATSGGWAPQSFAAPYDLGLDGAGNLHVVNTTCHEVVTLASDGSFRSAVKVGSETHPDDAWADGSLKRPHGIAVAANGNVCIGQSHARIRQSGTPSPCAGTAPAPGGQTQPVGAPTGGAQTEPATTPTGTDRTEQAAGPAPAGQASRTGTDEPAREEGPRVVPGSQDRTAPSLRPTARPRQRSASPTITARCDERCAIRTSATARLGGRTIRFAGERRTVSPGRPATLTLRTPAASRRAIDRARRHGGVTVTVRVGATDTAGNAATRRLTVRLVG